MDNEKSVKLSYYAVLKDQSGTTDEAILTSALTAQDLYNDLRSKYNFSLKSDQLMVSINDEFTSWETKIRNNDHIVFIPPVSGG